MYYEYKQKEKLQSNIIMVKIWLSLQYFFKKEGEFQTQLNVYKSTCLYHF